MDEESIIDLRKIDRGSANEALPGQSGVPSKESDARELVGWIAMEYHARHHGPAWYVGFAAISSALIFLGVLGKSYFFIALVVLAAAVLLLYTLRAPRELSCSVTNAGLRVGNKLYPFSEFSSFWIFENRDGATLSLETRRRLMRFLFVPVGSADIPMVAEALKKFLPEKEQERSLIDHLGARFGF